MVFIPDHMFVCVCGEGEGRGGGERRKQFSLAA